MQPAIIAGPKRYQGTLFEYMMIPLNIAFGAVKVLWRAARLSKMFISEDTVRIWS